MATADEFLDDSNSCLIRLGFFTVDFPGKKSDIGR
jgi:hypothetical protein